MVCGGLSKASKCRRFSVCAINSIWPAFLLIQMECYDEDKQRINQLGLKFRGKNWITFESALLNLVPSACTLSEAEILVEIYQQLIFAINDIIRAIKCNLNFELGQVLHRQFDPFTNTWHSVVEPLEWSVDQVPMPTIYPEIIEEINQLPMTNDQFEIDIIHTPIIADEKEGQRQGIVRFALLADHKSGYVYKHELVHLEHNSSRRSINSHYRRDSANESSEANLGQR
jgi:hypothetical protein